VHGFNLTNGGWVPVVNFNAVSGAAGLPVAYVSRNQNGDGVRYVNRSLFADTGGGDKLWGSLFAPVAAL
jgi:hypothetical protein